MFIDTEELLVTYLGDGLAGAATVSVEFDEQNDPVPFVLVTRYVAMDDRVTEAASAQVEVFHSSRVQAKDLARKVHSLMLALTAKTQVTLSTGVVQVDRVRTLEGPAFSDYQDENLKRYLARYEVESRINSQPLAP